MESRNRNSWGNECDDEKNVLLQVQKEVEVPRAYINMIGEVGLDQGGCAFEAMTPCCAVLAREEEKIMAWGAAKGLVPYHWAVSCNCLLL